MTNPTGSSSVTLYGISSCDTIRRTRRWLEQHGTDFCFHDYRRDGIDEDLLEMLLGAFSAQQLVNRRGTTWRRLDAGLRSRIEDELATGDSPVALKQTLIAQPALIRRPVLHRQSSPPRWLIGYDEDALSSL